MGRSLRNTLPAWLAALLLAACGGGGGGDGSSSSATPAAVASSPGQTANGEVDPATFEPNAPAPTGNTATDGFNWFNFRRQQIGLLPLARNAQIDQAALGHSNYQRINKEITHEQTTGKPGFTGVELIDRLDAAGYQFSAELGYASGEVISSTFNTSGSSAAEDLVAAIYHRFVIFEPMFKEAGAGAATVAGGNTYFTTDFAANGLDKGLGKGQIVVYPYTGQQGVARSFMSDNEAPDPVPNRNEVGYPISVHADIQSIIEVQEFTVRAHDGGSTLPARLLASATDPLTMTSAAAIVPLSPLDAGKVYDVQFNGRVDGTPVTRSWSFTTR
jgi:uncharacterized protein YkwD